MLILQTIIKHPIFWLGCLFKGTMLFLFNPEAAAVWYIPFMETTSAVSLFDPWSDWKDFGGDRLAFPYGYAMWLTFRPAFLLSTLTPLISANAYFLTLFLTDIFLLYLILRMTSTSSSVAMLLWWCSPIVTIATYAYGFNDVVPVTFLVASIAAMRSESWSIAGICLALSISSKLSMVLAIPIFALLFLNKPSLLKHAPKFSVAFLITTTLFFVPFLMSDSALGDLVTNPEFTKIQTLQISFNNSNLLILPFGYVLFLYWIWRGRRMNFKMFYSFVGMTFLALALVMPDEPGWFVWSAPFLVMYQWTSDRLAFRLSFFYSLLYAMYFFLVTPPNMRTSLKTELQAVLEIPFDYISSIDSNFFTLLLTFGAILLVRQWHQTILENPFFRNSRHPFVVGIAGDSSSGKDTVATAIIELLGNHSSLNLSGDDYHKYDRGDKIWQRLTHLNPNANNVAAFADDLAKLRDGKGITKRHYNHDSGTFDQPQKLSPKHFVITSGLHTFYLAQFNSLFDLKIYLDIDEDLRQSFKIERDTKTRSKTLRETLKSIETRKIDYQRYVAPQMEVADLIFALKPERYSDLKSAINKLTLMLIVKMVAGGGEENLIRSLVGTFDCEVTKSPIPNSKFIEIQISGDFSAEDIEFASRKVCPEASELLDVPVRWRGGMTGVMQLVTLLHISKVMERRGQHAGCI